jgi:hypothetical protein
MMTYRRPLEMKDVVGKPALVDKLKPELGGKIVKAIIDDNERANRAKEDKRKRADQAERSEPSD